MPSLGGGGEYGGDDPTGGYSGGSFGGDGGSANSFDYRDLLSIDRTRLDMSDKTIDEAQKELSDILSRQSAKSFSKGIAAIAGILAGVFTGSIPAGVAFAGLTGKVLSKESVQKALAKIQEGKSVSVVTASLIDDNGGRAEVEKNFQDSNAFNSGGKNNNNADDNYGLTEKQRNPKSNEFWQQFVKEWQSAKENMQAQQDYRQEQLEPAFETYKNRLSGLSQEPTFSPINVKMGDFSTSFLPKRSSANAESILRGELSRADVMDPQKANLSYLDKLLNVAQFQQELKNKFQPRDRRPDDQGSWLDAASDTLGLATQASDFIDKIF